MIKISVPNDDHVALRAMAKALEEIAVSRGAPVQGKQIGELNYKINIDTTQATATLEQLVKQAEPDTTSQQVESLAIPVEANGATYETDLGSDNPQAVCVADSTGTPWDERIHSASKALNADATYRQQAYDADATYRQQAYDADGTWRLRRKPADKSSEGWAEYVEQVSNELKWDSRQLGASEEHVKVVEEENPYLAEGTELRAALDSHKKASAEVTEPSVTPAGDDFHVDAGVVTEQQVVSFPPPPPVPVKVLSEQAFDKVQQLINEPAEPTQALVDLMQSAPKAIHRDDPVTMTFPQVMAFLTERHGRITSAQVDQIIADMGLEKITDLNTQPEHTGPFIARVKALLGE